MTKNDVAERLRQAITESGKTQMQIAEEVGVSYAAVSQWLQTGRISKKSLSKLAEITGHTMEWFMTGTGNALPMPALKPSFVPLISWVQAGALTENMEVSLLQEADEVLPCPVKIGPRGFALKVRGDSMTSPYPGAKSYPDGCYIYVDPDKPVTNGCRVVVWVEGSNECTFKTYIEDAGQKLLKPINPQYPTIPINGNARICGVVVCKTEME